MASLLFTQPSVNSDPSSSTRRRACAAPPTRVLCPCVLLPGRDRARRSGRSGGGGRTRSVCRSGVRAQVLEMAARLALVQLVPANHQSTERTVAGCRRASGVPRRDCEVLTSNSVCRVGGMRLLNVGGSRRNRRCRRSLVIRTGSAAREDTSKRQHRHRARRSSYPVCHARTLWVRRGRDHSSPSRSDPLWALRARPD
jgi:hypothetical protein